MRNRVSQEWVDRVFWPVVERMLGMVRGRLRVKLLEYLVYNDWCAQLSGPSPLEDHRDREYVEDCDNRLREDFDLWFEEESGFPMFCRPSHISLVVIT
jgi:hypothetical protein